MASVNALVWGSFAWKARASPLAAVKPATAEKKMFSERLHSHCAKSKVFTNICDLDTSWSPSILRYSMYIFTSKLSTLLGWVIAASNCARSLVLWFEHSGMTEIVTHAWDTRGGLLRPRKGKPLKRLTFIPDISTALMRPKRSKQYCLQLYRYRNRCRCRCRLCLYHINR